MKQVGDAKVASFSLGVTERGYTKKDGTKVEDRTDWFNCQAWRGQAEVIEKFVKKGDKLYVEGRMTSRRYNKDGVEKTAWDVNVSYVELLTPKGTTQQPDSPIAAQPTAEPQQSGNDDLPF
ncbi:single-strand binding family protein [gut metagenome]|uniref:Single-strand binding family protein n=1 Tax=gut metagenome TaxID=749906 RepID=J9F429_9ZZZZ